MHTQKILLPEKQQTWRQLVGKVTEQVYYKLTGGYFD